MQRNLMLRQTWVWEEEVSKWVKDRIKGKSLNVCCGTSMLGDVKIDLEPKLKGTLKGDMFDIQFADEFFDTVICDPPWKLNPMLRPRNFFELVRVCKVGGNIIFNAKWIPKSKYVKLKELYIRQ